VKQCRHCLETKPLAEFYKDVRRADGHGVYCKPCQKKISAQYYEKNHGSTHPLKKLRRESPIARFEISYMPEPNSGCWLWLGAEQGSNGYGRIKAEGRTWTAHRYSWAIHRGPIPDGMLVLHRCDNSACVNPNHLFLGTTQDNSDDKLAKCRHPFGSRHGQSKLTEMEVVAIRADSRARRVIADDYGVTEAAIYNIQLRKSWRHVS
jgi:hypothetical protein